MINKALKDNTDAVLANGPQRRETIKEDGYRRVLDKVGNETFPLLALYPTVEELHYWHQMVINHRRLARRVALILTALLSSRG